VRASQTSSLPSRLARYLPPAINWHSRAISPVGGELFHHYSPVQLFFAGHILHA
jgi:hypothetical protein